MDDPQQQNSLKEINKKYEILINNINEAVIVTDKDFIIVKCNQIGVEMLGLPSNKLIGSIFYDFAPKYQTNGIETAISAMQYINGALHGEVQFFEWVIVNSQILYF